MRNATTFILAFITTAAFAGEYAKEVIVPMDMEPSQPLRFSLAVPGWLAGLEGDVGIDGVISEIDVSPEKILRSIDMAILLRGEVSYERLSLMGDFIYLSLSDGIGSDTVVKKLDLQVDEIIGELAVRWRIVEGSRGWLDVYAGARYVNLHQAVALQANSGRINEASTELVDAVGDRLRSALSESGLRDLIRQNLGSRLEALDGRDPELPTGPLAGGERGLIRDRISEIIEARREELVEAIRDRTQAATAALREAAQERVDDIKRDLSKKIAKTLESRLDTQLSRTDDWWDPFIGLRARLNLTSAIYLMAKGDIGGFGVGSEFAWQAEGAIGCELTRSIFVEAGYRALGMDYEGDGLTFDTVTHGAQVTTGIRF